MSRSVPWIALLGVGCGIAAKEAMVIPTCETDDECVLPERCIEHHCSVPANSDATLSIEVAPTDGPSQWFMPGTGDGTDEAFIPSPLDETHQFTATLGRVVTVSGDVHPDGGGDPLVASIEITPVVAPPAWPLPSGRSAPVFHADPCRIDPSRWCASLPPGRYVVRVTSEGFAPFATEFDVSGDGDVDVPLELPEQTTFAGRVVGPDDTGGIAGVSVRAIAIGEPRPVSTSAVTGECAGGGVGCFEIVLPVTETDFLLRISTADGPLVPTLDVPRAEEIVLEAYGQPIRVSGWVEGPGGSDDRVPNAGLSFRSETLGTGGRTLPGAIEASTSVGLDGSFEIFLLAGMYEVQVVPPGDERFGGLGVLVQDQLITGPAEQAGMTFSLAPRSRLAGELRIGGLEGVDPGDVAIDALAGPQLWSSPGEFAREGSFRSVFGATEEDGTFSLAVDAGHYDVYFRPPLGTAAAWKVVRALDLETELVNETPLLTGGSVLVGTFFEATGVPLVGATVRIYANLGGGSVQIGEAVTDEAGGYVVFLPVAL